MKDFKGFLPVQLDPSDLEHLSEEEQNELWLATNQQASCIRRFLGLEGGTPSKPKRYREATWRLLQALDNALYRLTGAGMAQVATRLKGNSP